MPNRRSCGTLSLSIRVLLIVRDTNHKVREYAHNIDSKLDRDEGRIILEHASKSTSLGIAP